MFYRREKSVAHAGFGADAQEKYSIGGKNRSAIRTDKQSKYNRTRRRLKRLGRDLPHPWQQTTKRFGGAKLWRPKSLGGRKTG